MVNQRHRLAVAAALRGAVNMAETLMRFDLNKINLSKYLFFTGKGGVGKTSTACGVAVTLADQGKKVLLISTDPASNLQDVFKTDINGTGISIEGAPGLMVANLNPEEAARLYRESVVSPFRGKLPDSVIANMEEQLSGSCTVEIAAFDQFSLFITDPETASAYDHIIFDTAPTGHTLRMLQLPSAWSDFISESTHGASCLGQLAGLESKKQIYKEAVENLSDPKKTSLILVARPDATPLLEAERSSTELKALGINNQMLIINGVLGQSTDGLSEQIFKKQQRAIAERPKAIQSLETYTLPLRAYNVLGLDRMRDFLKMEDGEARASDSDKDLTLVGVGAHEEVRKPLSDLVEDLYLSGKKVIFAMGKGGVGKTTVAASIALGLSQKGLKVHLTSTDPADHIRYVVEGHENMTLSKIDEKLELEKYQQEVLSKARETMGEEDLAYIEEDLRSPCTQEIAVFRAFAEIVDKAEDQVVVIDTAPTGHTLLLLDSTQSYHREVERTKGETPLAIQRLLPRLRDEAQTEVVIVTLPEATPVFEANRLREDLLRAGINNKWWVVNQSLSMTQTTDPLLMARAQSENEWIGKVNAISNDHAAVIPWVSQVSIGELAGAR